MKDKGIDLQSSDGIRIVLNLIEEMLPKDVPTYQLDQFDHGVRAGKQMLYDELMFKISTLGGTNGR